jgi:hypothetical protein
MKPAQSGNARTLPKTKADMPTRAPLTVGDALAALSASTMAAIIRAITSLPPNLAARACLVPIGIRIRVRSPLTALDRSAADLLVIPVRTGAPITIPVQAADRHREKRS